MLSAFTARPIIELRQRDKSKIETILAYGDRVLVGLNTGSLRVYRLNDLAAPAPPKPANGATTPAPGGALVDAQLAAAPPDVSGTSPPPPAAVVGTPGLVVGSIQSTLDHPPAAVSSSLPTNNAQTAAAAAPPQKPTDLLREVDRFSPRAVEQLAIIKEANTLVSLSNYSVSLHDLTTYEPLVPESPAVQARTRNASCFATTSNVVPDAETGIQEIISRLAVAVRRRLLLWRWHDSELLLGDGEVAEVALPEAIRTLAWADATHVVCGLNSGGYALVDAEERRVVAELDPPTTGGDGGADGGEANAGSGGGGSRLAAVGTAGMGYMGLGSYTPKPLATKLAEGAGLLLARDVNTAFVTAEGKVRTDRRQIPWHVAPESIGYSYPYIVALQPPSRGLMEVRNPDTLSLLQTIAVPGAAQLHFPPPTVSLAQGKGFHVSAERCVWKMGATDYDAQVQELVEKGRFDEAVSVLGMLEDALLRSKQETLREVKMLKAEALFKARKFRDSMDLFNDETVHAPPERVLKLFPRNIAGKLSGYPEPEEEEDDDAGAEATAEPGADAAQAKTNGEKSVKAKAEGSTDAAAPSKAASATTTTLAAGGFTRYLMGHRKAPSDAASIASPKKTGEAAAEEGAASAAAAKTAAAVAVAKAKKASDLPSLEGKDLTTAVTELSSYLVGTRTRLQRMLDPVTGKLKRQQPAVGKSNGGASGLDAAFKAQVAAAAAVDGKVGGQGDEGDADAELEAQLRATFSLVDTTLFRAYMFSRPALAGSLFRIPNFCDPDVVNEKLLEHSRYTELVDFFHGKGMHRPALELLRKFGTQQQHEQDGEGAEADAATIATTTTEADGGETATTTTTTPKIPPALRGPQRTVRYLQNLGPELIDLVLEFADWTLRADATLAMDVFLADSEKAETLPRDRVVKFLGAIDVALEIRYLEHVISELGDMTPDFHNRLVELLVRHLKEKPRGDDWDREMDRLVSFLRESRQYSLSRAFGMIPRDDPFFYEAQAVVLSNMQQHKQALEIYVFKMKDYDKAEEYCNRIHKSFESSTSPNLVPPSTPPPSSPKARPSPRSRRASSIMTTSTSNGILSSDAHHAAATATSSSAAAPPPLDDDGDATTPSVPSIYHTLLSLYLQPPPGHGPPILGPALALLGRHGSRLPAGSTLALIPDALPARELEAYFRGRIRAANSVVNSARIEAGLRYPQLVRAQAELLLGEDEGEGVWRTAAAGGGVEAGAAAAPASSWASRHHRPGGHSGFGGGGAASSYAGPSSGGGGRNRRVVVAEDRMCGVCHKRLGNSVVAALPDNAVVHYGCLNRVGAAGLGGGGSQLAGGGGQTAGGGGFGGYARPDPLRAGGWGRSSEG